MEEIGWTAASTLRVQERTLRGLRRSLYAELVPTVPITSGSSALSERFRRYGSNALAPYW